jgi:hypothetical protein
MIYVLHIAAFVKQAFVTLGLGEREGCNSEIGIVCSCIGYVVEPPQNLLIRTHSIGVSFLRGEHPKEMATWHTRWATNPTINGHVGDAPSCLWHVG